jgi:hypothetical protein
VGVILGDTLELCAIFSEKSLVTEVDDRVYLCGMVSVTPEMLMSFIDSCTVDLMSDERLSNSLVVDRYASRLLDI